MTDTTDTLPPRETDLELEKRDDLRAKIEASERRNADRSLADQAKDAASAATEFVKERPLTAIGGAIAIGLLIGLATKPGRQMARRAASGTADAVGSAARSTAEAGRETAAKASRLGTLISDAIAAYGIKLIDETTGVARSGQDLFEDLGDSASAKARSLRRDTEYFAGSTLDKGRAATRRTRRRAGRAMRDLSDRLSN